MADRAHHCTTEAEPRGGLAGLADRLPLAMGKLPGGAADWARAEEKRQGAQ